MRVINLDETGIKLITYNKKQMYIPLSEINEFIDGKYQIIKDSNWCGIEFNNKRLTLTKEDIEEFPNILNYIKTNFKTKSSS